MLSLEFDGTNFTAEDILTADAKVVLSEAQYNKLTSDISALLETDMYFSMLELNVGFIARKMIKRFTEQRDDHFIVKLSAIADIEDMINGITKDLDIVVKFVLKYPYPIGDYFYCQRIGAFLNN